MCNRIWILKNLTLFNLVLKKKEVKAVDTADRGDMLFNGLDGRYWNNSGNPGFVIHCDSEQVMYPIV